MSVAQHDVARGVVGYVGVVRHEDDGSACSVQLLEENENLERGACVEVSRCLVGKNHGRVVHQRACYRHTLHLSARHLVRLMVETLAQSHSLQRFHGTLLALLSSDSGVVHQRQRHVLHACRLRQQIVVLEDEANLAVAKHGALRLRHLAHRHSVEIVFAR